MEKHNEVLRTFLIMLSVTLIMQLGANTDFILWLIIGFTTILGTAISILVGRLLGISAFSKTEQ